MNDISSDGKEVWDWADKLSDRIHKAHEVRRLREQSHNARNTCGSCSKWMTSGCPREVHSNRLGRSQGPSCMAIKCDQFSISRSGAASAELAETKIAELSKELA